MVYSPLSSLTNALQQVTDFYGGYVDDGAGVDADALMKLISGEPVGGSRTVAQRSLSGGESRARLARSQRPELWAALRADWQLTKYIQYVAPLRFVALLWAQVLIVEGTALTLSVVGAVPDEGCESVDAVVKAHSVLYYD